MIYQALTPCILLSCNCFIQLLEGLPFNEQFALLRGVKVVLLEHLLYLLISMAVVVLIRVVGLIL